MSIFTSVIISTVGKNTEVLCGNESREDSRKPRIDEQTLPQRDILDVPGRTIQVPTDDRQVRYGTVGSGLDLGRLVWPKDTHVFSSQAMDPKIMQEQLPGRDTTVKELGPAEGVRKNVLRANPIDVLLI